MNSKRIRILALSGVLFAGAVQSSPKRFDDGTTRPAPLGPERIGEQKLAREIVQVARVRYEAGNWQAANKILQASLELDSGCNEAWYYLHLVQKAMRVKKPDDKSVRPWYPTMPPRPIHE